MIHFDVSITDNRWSLLWPDLEAVCQKLCVLALKACNLSSQGIEVEIILCNDDEIKGYNGQYRQIDFPTNVLSFPQFNHLDQIAAYRPRPLCLGSILMSYDTLFREAEVQGKSFQAHGAHLFVHSVLHLLGFDHQTTCEAKKMEKIEVELLLQMNIVNPYVTEGTS